MLKIELVTDNDPLKLEKTMQNTITRIEHEGYTVQSVQLQQSPEKNFTRYSTLITYTA